MIKQLVGAVGTVIALDEEGRVYRLEAEKKTKPITKVDYLEFRWERLPDLPDADPKTKTSS